MSSAVVWRGPSQLTSRPIEAVLTGLDLSSLNEKTGPMVQAWILQAEGNPSQHLGTEAERDVCGDCPLSGRGRARICYVVYGLWIVSRHRHKFPVINLDEASAQLSGKPLRIGAYGDPAATPYEVWHGLLRNVPSWTGYTHQWRSCDERFRDIVMASVESEQAALEAQGRGWRTFRVRPVLGRLLSSEILCPYESRGVQCVKCRLCRGRAVEARSIAITVHGNGVGEFHRRVESVQRRLAL